MTELDHLERVRKLAETAAAAAGPTCPLDAPCRFPACMTASVLLKATLMKRGVSREDLNRVILRANDCAGGSYPYIASVRVDGREVYRILARPDEVFDPDVLDDIAKALRRPM